MRREGVAQHVGVQSGQGDPGLVPSFLDDAPKVFPPKVFPRTGNEKPVILGLKPASCLFDVSLENLAACSDQGDDPLLLPFTGHTDDSAREVDVGNPQRTSFAGAQAATVDCLEDGPVSPVQEGGTEAGLDDPFDLPFAEDLREFPFFSGQGQPLRPSRAKPFFL